MAKTNIKPIMDEIFKDCPPELKPEFKQNDYLFQFPNGSQIQMAGTDGGHHDTLRGSKADLWIVDEAGFCDELNYVVRSVLGPTVLTTGGRGIMASTPAKTEDHDFNEIYVKQAEDRGKLIKFTIFDNPLLTDKEIQDEINKYPLGKEDPEFRREYLCELIVSDERRVVPEFNEKLQQKIIRDHVKPAFYDSYVCMDVGGKDQTAILFAYYDFKNACIVIEDELVYTEQDFRIDKAAEDIIKMENKLWTSPITGELKKPYMRISDNNNVILLNDLAIRYNLTFIPTKKITKMQQLTICELCLLMKRLLYIQDVKL